MRNVYIIFSVVGWTWTALFLAFLWLRLKSDGGGGEHCDPS